MRLDAVVLLVARSECVYGQWRGGVDWVAEGWVGGLHREVAD